MPSGSQWERKRWFRKFTTHDSANLENPRTISQELIIIGKHNDVCISLTPSKTHLRCTKRRANYQKQTSNAQVLMPAVRNKPGKHPGQISLDINGYAWKSMISNGIIPWRSMNALAYSQITMDIHRDIRISNHLHKYLWTSMEIQRSLSERMGKQMDIHE